MHIIALSLNYKKTGVEEREQVTFQDDEVVEALHKLREQKSILEAALLSTCNRTELYVVSDQEHTGAYYSRKFLADWFDIEYEKIKDMTDMKVADEAISHLFNVTAGLDSMVLGETQILGQIRDAFLTAQEEHTTGTIFNKLFKEAITVAKRGHNETDISKNAVSISYAAVELAKRIFANVKKSRVLVIGAGEMAEESLLNLTSNGIEDVVVLNRSLEKAEDLAARFNGRAENLHALESELKEADIVISSTSSPDYVIKKDMIDNVNKTRGGSPLILIDIAMPRDIDPAIDTSDNVYMYNVDDLQGLVDSNLASREQEAEKIKAMIDGTTAEFEEWLRVQGVVPVIQAMRTNALKIHDETFDSLERKLPDMSERERTVISKHMKSIINQMLRDPIIFTKEIAGDKKRDEKLEDIMKMFHIEEEVEAAREVSTVKQREKLKARKEQLNLN
ncbi:glutamyl-tRNA reductase [Jeotgalicoccus coquinae]|uniref:Glutamyl-tRNA reductase n=1 Tax=Jeotgalicoccus coquinae TaxID=709509 RepID=A0A6V7R9G4_9STAP|nr:glutamyl-tRNA reductase [Jeotgalicoccus coquinae]MBB6423073.1 glutamyl-tRNA reductase [Jeotgalicoccus coquinae]GGE10910.1 glutamyl-tRNA reductase [Jeotgalicoccus coquinae]CAD2073462.1 Glutamyl-tRNA reductase [Jeotgalicoccus coquinae]